MEEGLYEWDYRGIATQGQLTELYDIIKRLMDATYQAEDEKIRVLLATLEYKARNITWRHLGNQTSCYGVRDNPGEAFNYNDYQMALFWDSLFLKVYSATYDTVDSGVLHPMLTDILQCQDNRTFVASGQACKGSLGVSVRDFARFGLLYLRKGNWKGKQLISVKHARMAVTSPLPATETGPAPDARPGPDHRSRHDCRIGPEGRVRNCNYRDRNPH